MVAGSSPSRRPGARATRATHATRALGAVRAAPGALTPLALAGSIAVGAAGCSFDYPQVTRDLGGGASIADASAAGQDASGSVIIPGDAGTLAPPIDAGPMLEVAAIGSSTRTLAGHAVHLRFSATAVPNATVTIEIVQQPAHGTIQTSTPAGTWLYRPDPGFTGPDGVDFVARAGDVSSSATTAAVLVLDNRSCQRLFEAGELRDGTYPIDPDLAGPAPEREHYCLMSLAGGGWTLLARSASVTAGLPALPRSFDQIASRPQAGPGFGWTNDLGSVRDLAHPYSVDLTRWIDVADILVVGLDARWTPVQAYQLPVGPGFLRRCATNACFENPRTVTGTCAPDAGPARLHYVLGRGGVGFIFDEISNPISLYGLFYDGFALGAGDCATGGNLNGRPGMILVR